MKTAILTLLLAFAMQAREVTTPSESLSENFTVDLEGSPDHRVDTWGDASAQYWQVHFKPPLGYRTRILRVFGNFVTAPDGKMPEGTEAYGLFALQTTSAGQSSIADVGSSGCVFYIQSVLVGGDSKDVESFNVDVTDAGLLGEDNVLVVKTAVFLNTTGLKIHMEPSWVMVVRFEVVRFEATRFCLPDITITCDGNWFVSNH